MVTVLGPAQQPSIPGRVTDMSGIGLRVKIPLPIAYGALVRVEGDDMLILGEVCRAQRIRSLADRSAAAEEGGYEVGVEIAQALASLSSLERFHRALLGNPRGSGPDRRLTGNRGRITLSSPCEK